MLKKWATENGLFISSSEFDETYSHSYFKSGAEADVYLSDDGRSVVKTNTASYHGNWEDFLDRLVAHIYLFEDTAYELIGFTEKDEDGDLIFAAVLQQSFVKATEGATADEIAAYLSALALPGLMRKSQMITTTQQQEYCWKTCIACPAKRERKCAERT